MDASITTILIGYCISFFLLMFVSTFVHERVHLYVLRFFGGDGYIGRCKGYPAVIHTTTVVNHNQRIIISLAPIPFDLIIHFFALYVLIYSLSIVNLSTILLCISGSILVSITGEIFDIKKALKTMKLKKEGKPIPIPDNVVIGEKHNINKVLKVFRK